MLARILPQSTVWCTGFYFFYSKIYFQFSEQKALFLSSLPSPYFIPSVFCHEALTFKDMSNTFHIIWLIFNKFPSSPIAWNTVSIVSLPIHSVLTPPHCSYPSVLLLPCHISLTAPHWSNLSKLLLSHNIASIPPHCSYPKNIAPIPPHYSHPPTLLLPLHIAPTPKTLLLSLHITLTPPHCSHLSTLLSPLHMNPTPHIVLTHPHCSHLSTLLSQNLPEKVC